MARTLKPVDDTPICDPAYAKRIDPVWMPGPVPNRFWEDRAHRRDYVLWSADRLRLRTLEDLYRFPLSACYRRFGGGGLANYWNESSLRAAKECFPGYDWKPWLFLRIPPGFWDSPVNRRAYMTWLGDRLGYRCADDWYQISRYDFYRNRGAWLLMQYGASPVRAVLDFMPARSWCEWRFDQVPTGFWAKSENRQRYLRWLGKQLGFRKPEDWYRIEHADFKSRHGTTLLHRYATLGDLMREYLPELDWHRINVHRPLTIEKILACADGYHARHGTWPTAMSGKIVETGDTWQAIDQCLKAGLRGLPGGKTLPKLLEEQRGVCRGRRPPILSEEQILRWADDYFAAHGKWPARLSGRIAGTNEDWSKIHDALYRGERGFSPGRSLARLLAQRRGVRNRAALPRLSAKQILAWADAHFAAYGKWPNAKSGPIAGSQETWCTVSVALERGFRGLRRGSLARLLAARRGVPNVSCRPPLTETKILVWAKAYFKLAGRWPNTKSGPIVQSPGDTWSNADQALRVGVRSLPGGSSLAKLLRQHGLRREL